MENHRVKNAPLNLPAYREDAFDWVPDEPRGGLSAGYVPLHPHLTPKKQSEQLRASAAAKLVSLARRERRQSHDQLAVYAGVSTSDLLAIENGDCVPVDVLRKIAGALDLNASALEQLVGANGDVDPMLSQAAVEFVSELEKGEALNDREVAALHGFRHALGNRSSSFS